METRTPLYQVVQIKLPVFCKGMGRGWSVARRPHKSRSLLLNIGSVGLTNESMLGTWGDVDF